MEEKQSLRNIKMYHWYIIFKEPLMWGPILISYLTSVGKMSLPEIYLMESIVLLGLAIFEILTGSLADLIGRKKTVCLGSLLNLTSIIWFASVKTPFDAWGANITWAIGFSLCSGADSALIYDTLVEMKKEISYEKINGVAAGNRFFLVACCSLATGFLAEINLRLPALLSIPGVALSVLAAFLFTEPNLKTDKYTPNRQLHLIKDSLLFIVKHKKIIWIIAFTTLIGVTSKIWFFTYNPYFELVNLDFRYYGFAFFTLNIIAWISSHNAHIIKGKIPETIIITLMIILIGGPILFMGSFVTVLSVGMIFFQNVVRGFSGPFLGGLLQHQIESEKRATILSANSSITGLTQFVALGVFGAMLKLWNLPFCLQLLGIFTLFLGILGILKYHKIFK